MASNPPGACCATGFKHEGTPVGEVKNIAGGMFFFRVFIFIFFIFYYLYKMMIS